MATSEAFITHTVGFPARGSFPYGDERQSHFLSRPIPLPCFRFKRPYCCYFHRWKPQQSLLLNHSMQVCIMTSIHTPYSGIGRDRPPLMWRWGFHRHPLYAHGPPCHLFKRDRRARAVCRRGHNVGSPCVGIRISGVLECSVTQLPTVPFKEMAWSSTFSRARPKRPQLSGGAFP